MIELVTVIALTGILSVGLGNLLQHPINAYADVSRRAELVSFADLAMQRLSRDLRSALPNSIRITDAGRVIELLHTVDGARYRLAGGTNDPGGPNQADHTASSDTIGFGGDSSWNILGRFRDLSFAYGTALPAGSRIAIYPTGSSVWTEASRNLNPGAITTAANRIVLADDQDEDQIRLNQAHTFPLESPRLRLYVVDTPVTYLCDTADASIWRISEYAIAESQPTNRTTAPLAAGRVDRAADRIESCSFRYSPGTSARAAVVTAEVILAADNERVRLLQQIQIPNAP